MDIQLILALLLLAGAVLFLFRKYFFGKPKKEGCEKCGEAENG